MKLKWKSIFLFLLFGVGSILFAQSPVKEDFKPAVTNQNGKEYPMVNSEGRVRAGIMAPDAKKVQLDISAVKYDLKKDEKGFWTGDSDPQD